jgi:hypothetical protein
MSLLLTPQHPVILCGGGDPMVLLKKEKIVGLVI